MLEPLLFSFPDLFMYIPHWWCQKLQSFMTSLMAQTPFVPTQMWMRVGTFMIHSPLPIIFQDPYTGGWACLLIFHCKHCSALWPCKTLSGVVLIKVLMLGPPNPSNLPKWALCGPSQFLPTLFYVILRLGVIFLDKNSRHRVGVVGWARHCLPPSFNIPKRTQLVVSHSSIKVI